MKALFVAGGTGGHVYPALEIARQFKNSGVQIHWIGKENSLEQELSLKAVSYTHLTLPTKA